MAIEFSRGWGEKCKIFLEKSMEFKLEKSSQLEDFLRLEADLEPALLSDPIELFVRFKAEGFRKIDLSAWIKSQLLVLLLMLLLLVLSVDDESFCVVGETFK